MWPQVCIHSVKSWIAAPGAIAREYGLPVENTGRLRTLRSRAEISRCDRNDSAEGRIDAVLFGLMHEEVDFNSIRFRILTFRRYISHESCSIFRL